MSSHELTSFSRRLFFAGILTLGSVAIYESKMSTTKTPIDSTPSEQNQIFPVTQIPGEPTSTFFDTKYQGLRVLDATPASYPTAAPLPEDFSINQS